MYLTDKLEQQLEKSSASSFVNEEDAMDEEILLTEADDRLGYELSFTCDL